MLPSSPRKIRLTLETSWIPGDQKTGVLRYMVGIYPSPANNTEIDSIFLSRVSLCTFSIDLLDKHGFKLATIPVSLCTSEHNRGVR